MTGGRSAAAFVAFTVLVATLPLFGGCLRDAPPPSDPELLEALGLDRGIPVYRFDLSDRSGAIGLFPAEREIRVGSLVQFRTRDRRVYSIHFERDSIDFAGWSFLESSAQTSSPPLVEVDARFVVTFDGAPPGVYPFRVEGQGQPARGRVVVEP